MSATIGSDDLVHLWWEGVTEWDPTSTTLVLEVDGTAYPCTWDAAATSATRWDAQRREQVTEWSRRGRTVALFRGVDRTDAAPVVALTEGTHQAKAIYALADGQVIGTLPHTVTVAPSST